MNNRFVTGTRALVAHLTVGALVATMAITISGPVAAAPPPPGTAAPPASGAGSPFKTVPPVWPTPQHLDVRNGTVTIPSSVGLVVGKDTDPNATKAVKQVLRAAGVDRLVTAHADDPSPRTPLTVYLGGPSENAATAGILNQLDVDGPAGLSEGGYVLAAGQAGRRNVIALSGVDTIGTFYAAQTLRQLVVTFDRTSKVNALAIRDWPETPLRGVLEGFYGTPWSHRDRISQIEFLGRTKQNSYAYSPKDDPYLRAQWRDSYPADQLANMKALANASTANHVQFKYTLSPGLSICYSSDSDLQVLVDKFQTVWDIGVRSFAIQLDDINYTTWNCPQDEERFGTGLVAAASAQTYLLNRVHQKFIATHPGVQPNLTTAATEYTGTSDTPYLKEFRTKLEDPDTLVYWTGSSVIPETITTAEAKLAQEVFGQGLLLGDNYPVNDVSMVNNLHFGPYVGREPGIVQYLAGLVVNPMNQAEASKVAVFTSGDFAWNPDAYNPEASWLAAVKDLGGDQWPALKVLAENNYSSWIDATESPVLRPLIDSFLTAYSSDSGLETAAAKLNDYFRKMATAPATLRAGLDNPALLVEVKPWLDKLELQGRAGQQAIALLLAQRTDDRANAWTSRQALNASLDRINAIPQTAYRDVVGPFLSSLDDYSDRWLGLTRPHSEALASAPPYTGCCDYALDNMIDGDASTAYSSNRNVEKGDYVGVDLGSVRAITKIDLLMGNPAAPGDYIRQGVLEYSPDGFGWTPIGSYTGRPDIAVTLPEGTKARYVRMRATAALGGWFAVREFSVTAAQGTMLTVSGAPTAASTSTHAAAVDGDADSAYVGANRPKPGDVLQLAISPTRPLDQLVILQSGESPATADVQVHTGSVWKSIGELAPGYTQLAAGGVTADAVRLVWKQESPAPVINEIVPWFTDVPAVSLTIDPPNADVVADGQPTAAKATVVSHRAANVTGTLTVDPPAGLSVEPAKSSVTAYRGGYVAVEVAVKVAVGTTTGSYAVPVTFTSSTGQTTKTTLTVNVTTAADRQAFASAPPYTGCCDYAVDNMIDGDASTAYSSNRNVEKGDYVGVDLGSVRAITKIDLLMGNPVSPGDYIHEGVLEYSADNTNWTVIGSYTNQPDVSVTLPADSKARYVRMRATATSPGWFAVREFSVTAQ
ncbi:beta-N-acetylglucosaminidase domain-containing protein [Micromonospora sp. NBC_01412]|uniref:beta-N-acetylglucosaminidase domain-containing protein n=1 Tax=Micromonospora sp. NBC_01412 TaxID=2903590 RepID=UPI003248391A